MIPTKDEECRCCTSDMAEQNGASSPKNMKDCRSPERSVRSARQRCFLWLINNSLIAKYEKNRFDCDF